MATRKTRKISKKPTKRKLAKRTKPTKVAKTKSTSGARKKTLAPKTKQTLKKKSAILLSQVTNNSMQPTQPTNAEAWKHKKNLPPQDLHRKERMQQKHSDVKRNRTSGFGSRHH